MHQVMFTMRFTTKKGDTMKTISNLRLLVLTTLLALGLAAAGCQSDNTLLAPDNDSEKTDAGLDDDQSDAPDAIGNGTDDAGIDDGEDVWVAPGFMNGSWRVAKASDDTPVVYFDVLQDEGDPLVEGDYLMGVGLYNGTLDGGYGPVAESSFDGTTLTIKWNPTPQDSEMLTLSATKVDENTLTGNITSANNPNLDLAVKVTRVVDEP
jgi:hypothetical protein